MRDVKIHASLLQGLVFFGMFEDLHQSQQGGQAHFVVLGGNASFKVFERGLLPTLFHHLACDRHLDTKEFIALAILSFARLEESGETFNLGGVLLCKDFVIKSVHAIMSFKAGKFRNFFPK